MTLEAFLAMLEEQPESVEFDNTLRIIETYYNYTPAGFRNGSLRNAPGENAGSCRIFAFAHRQGLGEHQTLHCFGRAYREEVLGDPQGQGHKNIRQFMKTGWAGIVFDSEPLAPKGQ